MKGKRQPPRRRTKVKYPRFSQPKRRLEGKPRSILFTVGGAALLVVGGAIAFGLLRGQGGGGKAFGPMVLLPEDTLFAVTFSTDTGQWKQLARLGTAQSQKNWQAQLKSLEKATLATGLSYEKNIEPWVGDRITMAFLPPSENSAADFEQQATVWVLPVRSSGRAKKLFINQLATSGNQAQKRTHQGVEIQEFQLQDQRYAIAVTDQRNLIFTTAGAPINQVIDTLKGKPSIAQSPRFSEAMGEIGSSSPLAQVYVNMPIATAQMAAGSNQPISDASLERIQEMRGLGSTITLDDDSTLNFKTISWLEPNAKHPNIVKNQAEGIAKHLPANTLMMTSGGNFQELWQAYAKGTPAKLIIPFNPKSWSDSFNELTGLDFNTTFVPWLDRKFAGAIVPAQDDNDQKIGLVMLAQTSDRPAAIQAFKQLDDSVRENREFQVSESKTKNASVITWRIPPGLPVVSHGWIGDKVTFFTLGAPVPVSKRLVEAKSSLEQADLFKAATASTLKPHNGQFYLHMPRLLKVIETNPLFPKLAPEAQQYAQGIETIGVTSAISSPWSTRYDIRVKLKAEQ
jgi:hypothetical protein